LNYKLIQWKEVFLSTQAALLTVQAIETESDTITGLDFGSEELFAVL